MDCFAALAMTLWERSDSPSMRRFMLRLRRCFQMFDRQRTVVRGHFPVVLSRYWIGSPFGPLVEHAGSLNQILGTGHGTPLMQMLASYVGRPTVSYPADPVQIGVLNRFRRTGPSSCRREPEPAHLHQARPAIAAVKPAERRPPDRTPSFDRAPSYGRIDFRRPSPTPENGFVGAAGCFEGAFG